MLHFRLYKNSLKISIILKLFLCIYLSAKFSQINILKNLNFNFLIFLCDAEINGGEFESLDQISGNTTPSFEMGESTTGIRGCGLSTFLEYNYSTELLNL